MGKQVGHQFLAKLGKKRLRPGGVEATLWLMRNAGFTKDSQVLEVACNMCTTSIELAQTYGCQIIALDMYAKALEKAATNIKEAEVDNLITLQQGNAMKLPFPDQSFDIIVNEAMLTMLNQTAKEKALKEYYRVLKPGGVLLTHDVTYINSSLSQVLEQLSQTIHINVSPLFVKDWENLFYATGFDKVTFKTGAMSLMSPKGMIKDEGFLGMFKILKNGLKKENRQQFFNMFRFFNKTGKNLNYIAVVSYKK